MARNIAPDDEGFLYRTILDVRWDRGGGYTAHHGPYTNIATAKAQLTREVGKYGVESGRIQRTTMKWEDVD